MSLKDIKNFFANNKTQTFLERAQHPYDITFPINSTHECFALNIPISIFKKNSTSWSDVKRGNEDYESLIHFTVLQFVGQALQNRYVGTLADDGQKNSFLFKSKNGQEKKKVKIIYEVLVRQIYVNEMVEDSRKQVLPKHLLLSLKNIVGVRIFFFANDPKFKFSDAFKEQIRLNRNFNLQKDIYDSDEDEDEYKNKRNFETRSTKSKNNAASGQQIMNIENNDGEEEDDRTPEEIVKDKIIKRRKRERSGGDDFFNSRKSTSGYSRYISIRDTPELVHKTVTDFQKLGIWMFDKQLGTKTFHKNQKVQSINFDMTEKDSPMSLDLLTPINIIQKSQSLGCHPLQCNPNNYIDGLNAVIKNLEWNDSRKQLTGAQNFGQIAGTPYVPIDSSSTLTSPSILKIEPAMPLEIQPGTLRSGEAESLSSNQDKSIGDVKPRKVYDSDEESEEFVVSDLKNNNDKKRKFFEENDDSDIEESDEDEKTTDSSRKMDEDKGRFDDLMAMFSDDEDEANDEDEELGFGRVRVDRASREMKKMKETKDAFEKICNSKKNRLEQQSNRHFKLPIPALGFEVLSKEMSPDTMLKSHFVWYPYSEEYLNELTLSVIYDCFQKKTVSIDYCESLQRELYLDYQKNVRKIDEPSDEVILRKHVKMMDEIENERKLYYTDPTTLLYNKMKKVQTAIHKIYRNDRRLFAKYMNIMRSVSFKLLHKTLDKDDFHLPEPLTGMLQYIDETNAEGIYLEQNIACIDISPYANSLMRMLLFYELDEVSTNHLLIHELIIASHSVHFYRMRSECELKKSLMLHGPPGTGKSAALTKVIEYNIEDTMEDLVSRSAKAVINPRAGNGKFEIFDESNRIYDKPMGRLSNDEQTQKRIENSAMTKGFVRHDATVINKETNIRHIEKYKTEYDHAKAVCTNEIKAVKGDATADRFEHHTIVKRKRLHKEISDFRGALKNPQKNTMHEQIVAFHRSLQSLVMYCGSANKCFGLPNANMDVFKIRITQALEFLQVNAPNTKFGVRSFIMCESQAITSVFHRAIHLVCFSELSPYRMLVPNQRYIDMQKKRNQFHKNDLKNFKMDFEKFDIDHLLSIGPHLVCTDQIALKEITSTIYHNMNPEDYKILKMIALHFGKFDVEKVFDYFDGPEGSENDPNIECYQNDKEMFEDFQSFIGKKHGEKKQIGENSKEKRLFDREEIQSAFYIHCRDHENPKLKNQIERKKILKKIEHYDKSAKNNNNNSDDEDSEDKSSQNANINDMYLDESDDEEEFEISINPGLTKPITLDVRKKNGKHSNTVETDETSNINYANTFSDQKDKSNYLFKNVRFIENRANLSRITYNTSFVRLPYTQQQLLSSIGSEFCRKYNLDEELYRDLIKSLPKRNVRCNFTKNVPEYLMDFEEYLRFNIASKMDKSSKKTVKNQEKGMINDEENNCSFLNIDILFEDPNRIIQKYIEYCQFKYTREQKLLLGIIEDGVNPYYLKPINFKPDLKKESIEVNNVNYANEAILKSVFNDYGSFNDDLQETNDSFANRKIKIEEDIEQWATKRHFDNEGYHQSNTRHYYPETVETRLKAIYYEVEPRVKNQMTYEEYTKHMKDIKNFYIIQRYRKFEDETSDEMFENDRSFNDIKKRYELLLKTMTSLKELKGIQFYDYEQYKNINMAIEMYGKKKINIENSDNPKEIGKNAADDTESEYLPKKKKRKTIKKKNFNTNINRNQEEDNMSVEEDECIDTVY